MTSEAERSQVGARPGLPRRSTRALVALAFLLYVGGIVAHGLYRLWVLS